MKDPVDDSALGDWFVRLHDWDRSQKGPPLRETLAYGDHPEQVIDYWGSKPVQSGTALITVHGGYFMGQIGRDLQNPFVREFARRGQCVFNVEYRRHGCGGGLNETTADIRSAIDFLSGRYGIDRFAAIGHSAGGYLALSIADHPSVELVVALGSVCDLAAGVRSGLDDGAIAKWMGSEPHENPGHYADGDLLRRAPFHARLVLIHGVLDGIVDVSQSRSFAAAARRYGTECELIELAEEGHFCFLDPRERGFDIAAAPILAWHGPRSTGR